MNAVQSIEFAARLIISALLISGFGIIFGLLYKGIDRKLSARMQGRIGPPVRQPFRDVRKLFVKENIVPNDAIPWLFHLAPLAGLVATITILLYIPIGGFPAVLSTTGDLILILYLLILPSLAMVIGGFSSGSPYAVVGAQREMATMIAYEFPLAIIIIGFAWNLRTMTTPFALTTITTNPIWNTVGPIGFIGCILMLVTLVIVTPAELSKIPFDASEAETEIAGGLLAEYSGRNLGLFYLTDGVKTMVMASLIVALFFPYNLTQLEIFHSITGTIPGYLLDFLFYLVKILLVVLFSVTLIRVAIARLKIDQIVSTYWVWFTLLSLIGLILVMWDQNILQWFGLKPLIQYFIT
ncbi:MAG: complex I subunit 1 family protein [Candidatus Thermoplasmatota archaeon]